MLLIWQLSCRQVSLTPGHILPWANSALTTSHGGPTIGVNRGRVTSSESCASPCTQSQPIRRRRVAVNQSPAQSSSSRPKSPHRTPVRGAGALHARAALLSLPLVASSPTTDGTDAHPRRLRHALQAKVKRASCTSPPAPYALRFPPLPHSLASSLLPRRCFAAAANRIRPLARAFCDAPASGAPRSQVLTPNALPPVCLCVSLLL